MLLLLLLLLLTAITIFPFGFLTHPVPGQQTGFCCTTVSCNASCRGPRLRMRPKIAGRGLPDLTLLATTKPFLRTVKR